MRTFYIYTNTYMPIFSPSGYFKFGLSKCLVPTPGLTSEYPTCSVRECSHTHIHTLSYTCTPSKVSHHNANLPKNLEVRSIDT